MRCDMRKEKNMTAKKPYQCNEGGKKEKEKLDGQNLNLEDFSSIIINFDYLYRNSTKFCSFL